MPHSPSSTEIWLFRHGETEWSLSGAHTGRTDIPLTENGRKQAMALRPIVAKQSFDLVLTSPLSRAKETCQLAGLGDKAQEDTNLYEWDYGEYEGKKTADIRKTIPDWSIWTTPIKEGESLDMVEKRAAALIQRCLDHKGKIALFAHGHILRILGAYWSAKKASFGAHLALSTASICKLGYERENQVISTWNLTSHLENI
ncbi:histidine phosphatase family protein [Entomobacter blattae]|uniref:Acid phosphatase n=1 Tax=Entomobacter blattae TaxID=2762277 RepID=A0A7H1NUC3_9PROT|nr:histidine phosphatase family protein [Entomobacter blattae]QNT79383.1 Acid phosphatase [Entomobacter blattae]